MLQEYVKRLAQLAGPLTHHSYIAEHGRQFTSAELTPAELDYISNIQWDRRAPKECYLNSQIEALILPKQPDIDLKYVEGYVRPGVSIGIEHAWLSINEKLVDPTIRISQPPGRITSIIPADWEFWGVELDTQLCLHAIEHGKAIPLVDDWECNWPLVRGPKTNQRDAN